ncbi:MAG TPA: prenyltransferase/squalene oxidase repeat-containing protein [Pirellulales bacterium]
MSSVDLPRCQLEAAPSPRLIAALLAWAARVGPFWAASVLGHLAIFIVVALVLGTVHVARTLIDAEPLEPAIDTVIPNDLPLEHLRFEESVLVPPPLEIAPPTPADAFLDPPTDPTAIEPPAANGGTGDNFTEPPGPSAATALAMFDSRSLEPPGDGTRDPSGRKPSPAPAFIGRVEGGKNPLGVGGGTKATQSAVSAALNWFRRHQSADGGWSLGDYPRQCKDTTCTGAGKIKCDPAATAFAVLPFLAAGQTHQTKGPYQKSIYGGLFWLVKHQDPATGSLGKGTGSEMYGHGLATICLCEAFGLSKDKQIGAAAQAAIKFIESAQNKDDGGWRYTRGQSGDTSVTGWQLMALKSGQMAGLAVDRNVMALGKKYLKLASSKSKQGGLFGYIPESNPSPTMTSVGLLCTQYLGATKDDPSLAEGHAYLMKLLPSNKTRNSYYWYYATQVMHNKPDADWDKWNFAMRRVLVESQVKEGCAAGSWDPQKPAPDGHAAGTGGRIMTTSLATLTLEVYYRYLPLYTLDKKDQARRPEK